MLLPDISLRQMYSTKQSRVSQFHRNIATKMTQSQNMFESDHKVEYPEKDEENFDDPSLEEIVEQLSSDQDETPAKIPFFSSLNLDALISVAKNTKSEKRNKKRRKNFTKEAILNSLRMKQFICQFCPMPVESEDTCTKHKPKVSYECEFCNKTFSFNSLLVAHTRYAHSKLIKQTVYRSIGGTSPKNKNAKKIFSVLSKMR